MKKIIATRGKAGAGPMGVALISMRGVYAHYSDAGLGSRDRTISSIGTNPWFYWADVSETPGYTDFDNVKGTRIWGTYVAMGGSVDGPIDRARLTAARVAVLCLEE